MAPVTRQAERLRTNAAARPTLTTPGDRAAVGAAVRRRRTRRPASVVSRSRRATSRRASRSRSRSPSPRRRRSPARRRTSRRSRRSPVARRRRAIRAGPGRIRKRRAVALLAYNKWAKEVRRQSRQPLTSVALGIRWRRLTKAQKAAYRGPTSPRRTRG